MTEPRQGDPEGNPYAPPVAPVVVRGRPTARIRLAGRGERLLAAILDNLVFLPCVLPLFLGNALDWLAEDGAAQPALDGAGLVGLAIAGLVALGLIATQIFLLVDRGMTIGKRLVGIRIVDASGRKASVVQVIVLRAFVPTLLGNLCCVFTLVDVLFIFGDARRCLHDMIAGTIVVYA